MKFKEYLALISDDNGSFPTQRLRWTIRKNPSKTAREEAIAAEVLRQANPRSNITGHFPWGPEEQLVLQQLWVQPKTGAALWRDVPIKGAESLYSTEKTKFGDLHVPNAIKEPGTVRGSFTDRIHEALGEGDDYE